MNNHQILKLIFNHDQRLNELDEAESKNQNSDVNSVLADFMKPDPTYSRLYFTATDLESESFGIDTLSEYQSFLKALENGLAVEEFYTDKGAFKSLDTALSTIHFGEVVVVKKSEGFNIDISKMHRSNSAFTTVLKEALENEYVVIYKDEAPNGFNLHLFTKKNIYPSLFYPLQHMLPDANVVVPCFACNCDDICRLNELGCFEGANGKIISNQKNIILQVGETRLAIAEDLAKSILVSSV